MSILFAPAATHNVKPTGDLEGSLMAAGLIFVTVFLLTNVIATHLTNYHDLAGLLSSQLEYYLWPGSAKLFHLAIYKQSQTIETILMTSLVIATVFSVAASILII